MEGDKGKVCVTGGTGFIASWLIMRLLEQGYSVHATVRPDPEKRRDISFLTDLPGATERLRIFTADLNDPDGFDAAIEGCVGVFHLATPMDLEDREPEEAVTRRAINGTIGILKSCLKSTTVKRVVYTSSISAVLFNNEHVDDTIDESFWSDVNFLRAGKPPGHSYSISKTLTEKAALEFAAENGLDLVTLLPSIVGGPFICHTLPTSVRMTLALVFGNREEYRYLLNAWLVHVDDVARAHMFLLDYPDAKGRYICSSDNITLQNLAEILSAKCPEFPIPTPELLLAEFKGHKFPGLSSNKLLAAGFKFKYGVEEMLLGAIKCCKEKGHLS